MVHFNNMVSPSRRRRTSAVTLVAQGFSPATANPLDHAGEVPLCV